MFSEENVSRFPVIKILYNYEIIFISFSYYDEYALISESKSSLSTSCTSLGMEKISSLLMIICNIPHVEEEKIC